MLNADHINRDIEEYQPARSNNSIISEKLDNKSMRSNISRASQMDD